MADLELQLKGFELTTAEILYHLPDYPTLLQTYLWQDYDLVPDFPKLRDFLEFWGQEIEASLHSVTVASKKIITSGEFELVGHEFLIH